MRKDEMIEMATLYGETTQEEGCKAILSILIAALQNSVVLTKEQGDELLWVMKHAQRMTPTLKDARKSIVKQLAAMKGEKND